MSHEPRSDSEETLPAPRGWPGGLWLLLAVGLVILGLVRFRERQLAQWRAAPRPMASEARQLAPRFELADHRRRLVKFERFLGRQRVIVVFFDERLGADRDPRVRPLIEHFDRIKAAGIEIVAISAATPFANRQAEERIGTIPFPLLTDLDVRSPIPDPVHRLWGRYDEQRNRRLTGLFLVGRDGTLAVAPDGKPKPIDDEATVLETLSRGDWP